MAKQSAKFYKVNGFIRSYQPKNIVKWVEQARFQLGIQISDIKRAEGLSFPLDGEIKIKELTFVFPPTKSFSKKKIESLEKGAILYKNTKPDLDNLEKLAIDSCNKLVWTDDARIVEIGRISKIFGIEPRIEISL